MVAQGHDGGSAVPPTIFASWAFMESVRRLSVKAREEEQVK